MLGPRKTRATFHETRHPEWVCLLDGIGPDCFTVGWMKGALMDAGYSVVEVAYPSTRYTIETIVEQHLGPAIFRSVPERARVLHFVTLSMGGIVLRQLMQSRWRPQNFGRAVMLAPPNRGSEVSDWLQTTWVYKLTMGPAGQQLTTAPDSFVNRLGPVDFPCGVLTGTRCFDPWFGWLFDGPNDGKVSVESARIDGMAAFETLPTSHYDICLNPRTWFKTVNFLQTGAFG